MAKSKRKRAPHRHIPSAGNQDTRAYEGANSKDGWRPRRGGASANADHRADSIPLRVRARSLYQNVPYVTRAVESLVSAWVGSGVSIYSTSKSKRTKRIYEERLQTWQYECDADGLRTLDAIVQAAELAAVIDGECLIRRRPRRDADGLSVPLQIQLLEIDWLDSTRNGPAPNSPSSMMINGIQYSAIGRVEGYWLYDAHPGDTYTTTGRFDSRLVPASEIIHYFEPKRPGQGRGISRLHSVIARVRDFALYEDAELARKNLESRMGALASEDPEVMANPRQGESHVTDQQLAEGDLGLLPSGGITRIPAGMNITMVEPKAAPGMVEYSKLSLHLICAGIGVPYHMATGDVSEVNFSSARIRDIDFRRDVDQHQWMCLAPRLVRPILKWVADAIELNEGVRADYSFDYSMPKWDYVNPKQDIDAERGALEGGLTTLSESLRRRGFKPEEVFAEMATDFQALESSGAIKLLQLMRGEQARTEEPAPPPQD
jgi:lambda family phage portal protein